ncbi:hypothetical protein AAFF_G00175090 [Aldrovandia affinis]|uniref:Skin secretory protein xP2-like n=1 Tax=Aldrovandia affinis TaxID=143900 RepID=A0AAD7RLI6_9TELE|nr:hypothetical protein AAFF_G00175090 [Aldrovandia affinis]
MGCSTSTQTTGQEGNRPSSKPEESNGAGATVRRNENGSAAEDSETIPDQIQLPDQNAGSPAAAATEPPVEGAASPAAPAPADAPAPSPAPPAAAASTPEPAPGAVPEEKAGENAEKKEAGSA